MRVEVQAPGADASLVRAVADRLRGEPGPASALRAVLVQVLAAPEVRDAFDVFGSDLPDEAFEGVFDQPRDGDWRDVDL